MCVGMAEKKKKKKKNTYISLGRRVELQGIYCFRDKIVLTLSIYGCEGKRKQNEINESNFEGLGIRDVQYFFYDLRRECFCRAQEEETVMKKRFIFTILTVSTATPLISTSMSLKNENNL